MGWKQQIKCIARLFSGLFQVRTSMDPEAARAILEQTSPCPRGTCIANNQVQIDHDLQIIIPAYNAEQYIAECLDSVMAQETSCRCLVTVVNDGSTDRTSEILECYLQARRNAYIDMSVITQENRGFSGARNAALRCIRGEYMMFLDADDVLPPGAIRYMMDMARKTNADLVQGSWYDYATGSEARTVHRMGIDGRLEDNRTAFSGYPWGKLYRYVVLEHFQFPEGFWYEDTPVSFILAAMPWQCAATRELVYGYRRNPNGITVMARRCTKALDSYWIIERCLEELPDYGPQYDQRAYEYLLWQAIINARRFRRRTVRVRKAAFVMLSALMEQYFATCHATEPNMLELEAALRNRQFYRYELLAFGMFNAA